MSKKLTTEETQALESEDFEATELQDDDLDEVAGGGNGTCPVVINTSDGCGSGIQ